MDPCRWRDGWRMEMNWPEEKEGRTAGVGGGEEEGRRSEKIRAREHERRGG